MGEGSAMSTDPQHTPTFIQPSPPPQKTQKPRKPKRKDTQVPQPSGPTDIVTDEVVHKELGDRLVRAATTASSLKAEQDNETMGDTISQTRFKNVSKHSNDSLLARGNTLRSDKDRLKLNELMELCTNLQKKVLDLEQTNTTQQIEIDSLKRRVKKLEKKRSSRTHKLKRLYKVGLSARVESSGDEESLGEDASKQGRINAIDADDDITLVSVQDDANKEMFDVDALNGEEVFVADKEVNNEVNVVKEVAQVSATGNVVSTVGTATTVSAATTATDDDGEITLAQALIEMKSTKPKVKGIVFQEPSTTTTITTTISSQLSSQDKGKGIMMEPKKPMKKKDQISFDEETALKLQAEFDEEARLAREKAQQEQEANIAFTEEWDDIQDKIEADHELAQRLQSEEQEDLSVEEKAKLFQQLLEQRRKHFAAKRAEKKRNKPPTQAQQRKIMCNYLKNMEGKKLKDLKNKSFDSIQKMFDRAFKRVNTFVDFITDLVKGSSKRAREELEQESTKKQKVDEDKDITKLQSLMEIIPDEEEVTTDAIPLVVKVFSQTLKSFTREDLEDLYKLVIAKYKSTRPMEDLGLLLWGDLKTMFEPHVQDQVWKNQQNYKVLDWKLYDSCGVHSLRMQHVYIHMLVEKKYPLIPSTITDMLNKKLQVDYFSKMAYQLLKLLTKQLKNQ
ncbi:hypothetical protein Tco_0026359 [Tanacetum coccineum]